uniref:hypothetical protein n=1 Tax=Agathobacter sp. TaxID=2021311 RepID=UPI0040565056
MRRPYINFYFKNLIYDDSYYMGEFSSPDSDVFCQFEYNRKTEQCKIWNNSLPIDDIAPIPVWWLDKKLKENGILKSNESKISY